MSACEARSAKAISIAALPVAVTNGVLGRFRTSTAALYEDHMGTTGGLVPVGRLATPLALAPVTIHVFPCIATTLL